MTYLLDELLSPLITPFVLYFSLRNKSQDIIDFLRNFTIDVSGNTWYICVYLYLFRCRGCVLIR